jgi:uncharacterized protein (TIGR02285 family)
MENELMKHNNIVKLFVVVLVFIVISTIPARAEDSVVKVFIPDFAPFFINTGKLKGTGSDDRYAQAIIKALPKYKFILVYANYSRFFDEAKRGTHCIHTSVLKKPEREAFLYYSKPTSFTTNHVVVFDKKNKSKFKKYIKDGRISLKRMIADTSLKLGITQDISFDTLNPIVDKYRNSPHVYQRAGGDVDEGLLIMLENGRFDYTIAYIETSIFLSKKANLSIELAQIPILENSDKVIYSYTVAPKNEWGKKIIDEVNSLLENTDLMDKYYKWLNELQGGNTKLSDDIYKDMVTKYYPKKAAKN